MGEWLLLFPVEFNVLKSLNSCKTLNCASIRRKAPDFLAGFTSLLYTTYIVVRDFKTSYKYSRRNPLVWGVFYSSYNCDYILKRGFKNGLKPVKHRAKLLHINRFYKRFKQQLKSRWVI